MSDPGSDPGSDPTTDTYDLITVHCDIQKRHGYAGAAQWSGIGIGSSNGL